MAEESGAVYKPTTEADTSKGPIGCVWLKHLGRWRFAVKVLELVLSFIAFICEELVEHCQQCGGLYFFEFVSCTAFLLCIVVLVVYCTTLADRFSLKLVKCMDVWYTAIVGICFLVASIIFAATKYGSPIEGFSVAFGFLASFTFMADFCLLWKKGARLCKSRKRQGPEQNQPPPEENRALNNERSGA